MRNVKSKSGTKNSVKRVGITNPIKENQMSNFVKTTVKKLSELPWPDLRDLFSWSSSGSTIQAENPNLLIAKATNERGEVVVYATAEPVLLVDSFVVNPNSTPDNSAMAGDPIDKALAET